MPKVALLLVVFALLSVRTAGAQVTAIPAPLDDGAHCRVSAINDHREVLVGCFRYDADPALSAAYSFVWSMATSTGIQVPRPDSSSQAYCPAINQLRQVLCWYYDHEINSYRSYLWASDTGTVTQLGVVAAVALNDLGDVLMNGPSTGYTWVIRRADGTNIVVPFPVSDISGMSNNREVLVYDAASGGWNPWTPTGGLKPFVPQPPAGFNARVINDGGQINGNAGRQALRYTPGEGWAELALPAAFASDPSAFAIVQGMNVQGQVAGTTVTQSSTSYQMYPVLWRTPSEPVTLASYNGERTYASAVNNLGLVGGYATTGFFGQPEKAVVWETSPPPPPAPTQRIAAVYSELEKLLASGQLATGDAEGLLAKLDGVARAIEGQETPAARKILTAAANQVGALLRSRRITQANADSLRILLTAAIDSL